MSHLADIQSDFQAYLMKNEDSDVLLKQIVDDKKVGARKRLSIYADAYIFRIIEALATAYPKLQLLMGEDLFDQTARGYIAAYPSNYRNMRWVGDQMAEYLNNTLPEHPIASEMAGFEWSLGLAFDAKEVPALQLEALAAIPPEEWPSLNLVLNPSVQVLPLQWNIIPFWQALEKEENPPELTQTHTPCVVWRKDLNSLFRSIGQAEYCALKFVMQAATFGELCEHVARENQQQATEQAAQYLSTWLNEGMLENTI